MTGVDVRGSVFCFGEVRTPWCFEGGATKGCLFHVVVSGEAWLTTEDDPMRLGPGDVLLLPRGGRHKLGSRDRKRATPLRRAVEHRPGEPFARLAVGGDGAPSYLICGTFEVEGLDWHPMLRQLPDTLVVQAGVSQWLPGTLAALQGHLEHSQLGASLIAGRLAEILFVQVVGTWLQQRREGEIFADPQIGQAIGLMHRDPAGDWSAVSLARAVGMSRSAFFQRFAKRVSQTPAAYLRQWRMTLAARALKNEEVTLRELADRLGYASEASLSRAFRDTHGMTPGAYRRAPSMA